MAIRFGRQILILSLFVATLSSCIFDAGGIASGGGNKAAEPPASSRANTPLQGKIYVQEFWKNELPHYVIVNRNNLDVDLYFHEKILVPNDPVMSRREMESSFSALFR